MLLTVMKAKWLSLQYIRGICFTCVQFMLPFILFFSPMTEADIRKFSPEDSPVIEIIVKPSDTEFDIQLTGWYCNPIRINETRNEIVKAVKAIEILNGLADSAFFSLSGAAKNLQPFSSLPLSVETIKKKNKELSLMESNDYFTPNKEVDTFFPSQEELGQVKLKFYAGDNTSRVVRKSCMTPKNLAKAFGQYQTVMLDLEVAVKKYQSRVDREINHSKGEK